MGETRFDVVVTAEEVLKLTERAVAVRVEGELVWLPLSQVADPDQLVEGECEVELWVTEWIAEQKGIA